MPPQPNIKRAGRIARAITGLLTLAAGGTLWVIHWPASPTYRLILTAICVAAGAFQLYEAKRSWCVMRACGVRTPM